MEKQMGNKISVAVLITCFNRKPHTLNCLRALAKQEKTDNINLTVYLVDDGSTDGTGDAVRECYPDVVVIDGTGNLFWNQGMRVSWSEALKSKHDFYLWINDDTHVNSSALHHILDTYNTLVTEGHKVGAIVGSVVDPVTKIVTYGGRERNSSLNPLSYGPVLKPNTKAIPCDFINGNFTLIPAVSVESIGILSNSFTHSMGDFDYGLRLAKAGLSCWIAPGVYGECSDNTKVGGWEDNNLTLEERIAKTQSITQLPPVNEWQRYVRAHGGFIWPLLWFKAWIRGTFPTVFIFLRSK